MPLSEEITRQITVLTGDLIQIGLCNEQNYPKLLRGAGGVDEVTIPGAERLSVALKNVPYPEVYLALRTIRAFNLLMIDGAMLQIQYQMSRCEILRHRLAFIPSPDLSEYQNSPEIYEEDEMYADVVLRSVVPSPIRFDFDRAAFVEGNHPMSHLTIGQYKNCRIPVGGPLSPYLFVHFVLNSFYNTGFRRCSEQISRFRYGFQHTITQAERAHIHLISSA